MSPIWARGLNSDGVTHVLMALGTECYRFGISASVDVTDELTQAVLWVRFAERACNLEARAAAVTGRINGQRLTNVR